MSTENLTLKQHIKKETLAFFVSGLKSFKEVEAFYVALKNEAEYPLAIWGPFERMSRTDLIENMDNLEASYHLIAQLAQRELLEQIIKIKNILEQGENKQALQSIYHFLETNDKLKG